MSDLSASSIYDPRATALLQTTLEQLASNVRAPWNDGRYGRAEHQWRLALERGADPYVALSDPHPCLGFYLGAHDPRLLTCMIEHGLVIGEQHRDFLSYVVSSWRATVRFATVRLDSSEHEQERLIDLALVEVGAILCTQPIDLSEIEGKHLSFLHRLMWSNLCDERLTRVASGMLARGVPLCGDVQADIKHLADRYPLFNALVEAQVLKMSLQQTVDNKQLERARSKM